MHQGTISYLQCTYFHIHDVTDSQIPCINSIKTPDWALGDLYSVSSSAITPKAFTALPGGTSSGSCVSGLAIFGMTARAAPCV